MLVRPILLHRMALVSVRLFCKKLRNLQEFFGQRGYRPHWQKIVRTPMALGSSGGSVSRPGNSRRGPVCVCFLFCLVFFFNWTNATSLMVFILNVVVFILPSLQGFSYFLEEKPLGRGWLCRCWAL